MNVQELIDKLQAVEDKTIPVVLSVPILDFTGDICGSEMVLVEGAHETEAYLEKEKTQAFYISEH